MTFDHAAFPKLGGSADWIVRWCWRQKTRIASGAGTPVLPGVEGCHEQKTQSTRFPRGSSRGQRHHEPAGFSRNTLIAGAVVRSGELWRAGAAACGRALDEGAGRGTSYPTVNRRALNPRSCGSSPAANPATPGIGTARTPHHLLNGIITPNGLHFDRSHSGTPDIDPDQHRLLIHGLVKRPLVFTLENLSRYR